MNDPRREIAATVADTGRPEAESALRVLRLAFGWAAEVLEQVDDSAGGSHALGALFALDEALEEGRTLDARLPGLLAAAAPGDRVAGDVEDRMRRHTELTEQVAAARADLAGLRAAEEALANRLAEHETLRRQVDELRRRERLVLALDALQEQQEVITDRLAALRGRDTGVEEALRTSSDALVRLSEDQLAVLAPQTRQLLDRAAAAQGELADAEDKYGQGIGQLAACQTRLAQIQETYGARLASLRRYAAADRDLARALGEPRGAAAGTATPRQHLSLAEVEAAAADMERRLRAADECLHQVIAEREARDHEGRSVVPWAR
ncbi:hypothetical protein AQI95_14905 [Streptomyces yokosukanensis]|uniref:Uncharacterized protein n=1 Tax=Streptomyces yokosukanensis TaxID=67386 RepID=A0A101P757_9ACTN|nr:hypothetical protein [Streptomyces yokosukanensis]KUN06181.1 hypothetical protein AQI95_14905 [Streptomyces yokosukanensis]